MSNMRCAPLVIGLCCVLLAAAGSAQATTILSTATDLPDALGPRGDLWQYSYTISGFTFPANFSFTIFFDRNLYSDLEESSSVVHPDWDIVIVQPDLLFSADGFYDALALVDGASLADPFTVRFVWLGGNSAPPGAQPFTINEFDNRGILLRIVEPDGQTQPTAAVPEPGTLGLCEVGLLGIVEWKVRARRTRVEVLKPPG
jgi:hypothetical protein